MNLNDFVLAQLARADRVVCLGHLDDRFDPARIQPVAEVALLDPEGLSGSASVSLAEAGDDVATMIVLSSNGSLECVFASEFWAVVAGRPVGSRCAVIADDGRSDVAVMSERFADAGQQVVHVAGLDDALGGPGSIGVSLERVLADAPAARAALAQANLARMAHSPLTAAPTVGDGVREMRAAVHRERTLRLEAEARALAVRAELAVARTDLARLRRSASVQLGRAVTTALRDPRRGVPALPGRARAIVKDRRARGADGTRDATASTRDVTHGRAAPTPRPPIPFGRNRRFELTLPDASAVGPSPFRRDDGPSTMTLDVPFSLFIPLRLERDGLAGYEPETLAWWLALCDLAGEGVVWDVGANTGLFAALAARTTTRDVVAFEPTPELAVWARVLAAENGLDYTVEQVAASDVDGTATFFLSDSTDSSSSLSEGFRESTHQLDVVTERLDTYQRRRGRAPAVIKVDTETTEPAVLRGASSVVLEHRPWILCEVLANCGVEEPLMELVQEWGYRWYHLTEDLPPPAPERIRGDETFTYFMYLLAPEAVDEDLLERVRAWRSELERCTPR